MPFSHLKLNVGAPGSGGTPRARRKMSLAEAVAIVRSRGYSRSIEQQVISELSSRPEGTYVIYLKRLHENVRQIVKKQAS